jgi:hypothetical protein
MYVAKFVYVYTMTKTNYQNKLPKQITKTNYQNKLPKQNTNIV